MFTGAQSEVKLGIESTFGTAATWKYLLPAKSESLNYKINTVVSEALLRNRAANGMALGTIAADGSMDLECYPHTAGLAFYLALGLGAAQDPDGTANSGDEYYEITPVGVDDSLPSVSIEVAHSSQPLTYLGEVINTLKFSGSVGGIPTISLGLVGVDETTTPLTAAATTVEPGDEPYQFKELTLYTDEFTTIADTYSSIELNINNNLDDKDYRLDGTGKRKTITPNKLEITGSIDIIFDASATGTGGAYSNFKNFTDGKLGIKLSKSSDQQLFIYLPRVKFTEMTHDISSKEKIMLKASFTALVDSTDGIIVVKDYTSPAGY